MRLPLLRKELREQRPFLLLGLFLVALECVSLVLLHSPDLRPLATTFSLRDDEQLLIKVSYRFET